MAGLRLFGPTHQLLDLSMRVRAVRHEMLSSNIANAETPGYRPRDLDFNAVMKSLAGNPDNLPGRDRDGGFHLISTTPLHLEVFAEGPTMPNGQQGEDRLDGNSVNLDRQMALLTENALAYEANLTLLSRTLAALRYVIGEGRR